MSRRNSKRRIADYLSKAENKVRLFRMAMMAANAMLFVGILIFIYLNFSR